ncbi:L-cysteine desulfhydrase [Marchantia polymorpha subsp. ruderalis]|uniref:Aminotransferase class V domain-containing protein n=2 Tax=Marchantia polymorpha TaxID=3197 RepID=A0AAF6BQ83_MARPO|nr:hypothetical protein MARPO_0152s0013 [Marchantia polymorpha]BBN14167.1 hypothetical protein Mp_6g09430 [Marchantia polymorpha subsp. ruderalis]|eukprot:PTQ28897.1 hypothetical protein MARPO_0152s0013 [Marchantia polymorpha]
MQKSAEEVLAQTFQRLKVASDVREREFDHHEAGVARLNHGSFGSCPSAVQKAQEEWKHKWFKQPDTFVYHQMEDGLLASRTAIARLINAQNVDQVVLLDNATTAASMVAQELVWGFLEGRFHKGDAILLLNHAYGAYRACFEAIAARVGAELISAKIPFPVSSPSHALGFFRDSLAKAREESPGRIIRLAVLDHITSMPSMLLPVKDMVSLCRSYGVEQVFVDGAHAFGSVEVDVQDLDADFYTSNCHKWFFAPEVVAFFHCKPQHLGSLHHPVVSTTHGLGLAAECSWVGTRDYSAQLAIPAAEEFVLREAGGLDALRRLNHDSVLAMGDWLANEWGTACGAPPEMVASMVMVGLPPVLNIQSFDEGLDLRTRLREEFHVEVPMHYVSKEDQESADRITKIPGITAYARVSHQIYNKMEDYVQLRDAINSLVGMCTSK